MAWPLSVLHSVWACFWTRVCPWFWRLLALLLGRAAEWKSRVLGQSVRPAVPDPSQAERGNSDPGASDGDSDTNRPLTGRPEDVEAGCSGGQGEAPALKRPKTEEEDEEYGVETTDEFYCEYDSTWEDDGERKRRKRPRAPRNNRSHNFRKFERAAVDMQNFRKGYPNQSQGMHKRRTADVNMPNLEFYLGKAASEPDGIFISDFHSKWKGKYEKLEYVHTFIQWLFPLQEPGMNSQAHPLTPEEVEKFRDSDEAKNNLLLSYKLMLDFYGIELCDEKTGDVKKATNWSDRFHNLNCHTHNNLRITRILKCLGTLGFEHYQAPLVQFFLEETLVRGKLPRVKESVLNYFMFAVLDKRKRRELIKFAFSKYDRSDEFVWCPKKIQRMWQENPEGGAGDSSSPMELSSPNTEVHYEEEGDDNDTEY